MSTQIDMVGMAKARFADVRAILENPASTAEDKARADKLMVEGKDFQARALQLKEITDAALTMEAQSAADASAAKKPADAETKGGNGKGWGKDWGEYLYQVWRAGNPKIAAAPDPRLVMFKEVVQPGETKDMAENVGATGGFLVPPEFDMTLRAVMAEQSLVRSRATVIRMARRQINIPVLDQTSATAGVPCWFGGMNFYWAEEAEAKTEDDPNFRQIELVAHKIIGYTRASDELVADSAISLNDFLSGPLGMAGGLTWHEDYAFLRGTGAGQPLGIINAGATIVVPRAAVGTPIQYVDLVNMLESFLPNANGIWILNQSCMSNLLTMQDPGGSYVWQPNAREGVPQTLFGMPVYFTEKLPTVGNQGDVLLADLRYYLIGDRQATTIESTKFDRWRYDQTSWRAVHRVDGQPWLSTPLHLADGTLTISPFIILGAKTT
jgi:HK97 family phage major capsid protein